MAPKSLKYQIAYGVISGFIYATFIAIVDYYKDEEFSLNKFIIGMVAFGIAMFIATKIRNKKEK
ncbi:hypothetical protein [uncultured Wocania sp.]|uniref:hypothetical protein n=1 Tax=uncultured Wocania sp. TaxID=2834404 RepID=UPI0030F67067